MASRSGRRGGSSLTDLISDITDTTKDFVDDEVVDRGRDSERDLRRAGRNWVDDDDDDDDDRSGSRGRGRSRGRDRDDDLGELREAIVALSKKVKQLDAAQSGSTGSRSRSSKS